MGQPQMPDPWANGNLPTTAYDNADPFDNAMPDNRGQRAQLADPRTGQPVIHTDREPVYVSPPSLRTLGIGTLLLIVPKKIERDIKNNRPGAWKPTFSRLTADVIVCDGQGRMFGGDPTRGLDDMLGPFPVPCVIEDMWIDKDGIIDPVEKVLGTGFKIGRITKVKTSNDRTAWNFSAPHEDPAIAAQVVQSLRPLWQAYLDRQLPILSLKTLGERYGVKPGTAAQTVQANFSPYGQQPMTTQAQPGQQQPQWPTMQPGQNMAPVTPVSSPLAAAWTPPAADWTLNPPGGLPPALEAFRAQWPTLQPQAREMLLTQAGVPNPNTAPAASIAQATPGAYAQGPGY